MTQRKRMEVKPQGDEPSDYQSTERKLETDNQWSENTNKVFQNTLPPQEPSSVTYIANPFSSGVEFATGIALTGTVKEFADPEKLQKGWTATEKVVGGLAGVVVGVGLAYVYREPIKKKLQEGSNYLWGKSSAPQPNKNESRSPTPSPPQSPRWDNKYD